MDQNRKRKQIFVVAGNHREFVTLVGKKKYEFYSATTLENLAEEFPDYIYVSHVDILRGRSEIEGFYWGTYWSRPDLQDIKFAIDVIKARKEATLNATV